MAPVFEIIPEAIFFQQTNLICEISSESFSYFFENDIEKKIYGLSVFYFNKDADISEQLKSIFNEQPLLSKTYKKVFISYSGAESILLPAELYKADGNDQLLNMFYGDLCDRTIATDHLEDKKIYNVYRMPAAIRHIIVNQFPLASFAHQYSLLIKQSSLNSDLLKAIFYRDTFVAALLRGGELQIINIYLYQAATDVVYHLMNICQQFKMTDVPLGIGGMIEINSDMHKEIRHYIPNITFDELPPGYEFTNSLKKLPSHYFSHLFSIALCV
ncbi:MAG: DUF3822 family protein [Chitinophagaceae bacterium]